MKVVPQTQAYKTTSRKKSFKIVSLNFPFWRLLFSEQIFLPKFSIEIQNTGLDYVNKGAILVYLGVLDDNTPLNAIAVSKGELIHTHTEYFDYWAIGEVIKMHIKLKSDYIRENSYWICLKIEELLPQHTSYSTMIKELENDLIPEDLKKEFLIKMKVDQASSPIETIHYHKGYELVQIFVPVTIKVKSLANSLAIAGGLSSIIIAIFSAIVGFFPKLKGALSSFFN